jgi:SecD/SecF fusion protein
MQGKGIVRFFLVVVSLVCFYQYLLILPTNKVEKQAEEYAKEITQSIEDQEEREDAEKKARIDFLDSMSTEVVFSIPLINDFTYQDLKQSQLALGLDLKGGMSVVLQVDLREFIKALSYNYQDPVFEKALDEAAEALKSEQSDYVTLFVRAWKANTDENLAVAFRRSKQMEVNSNTSDGEIQRQLQSLSKETVQRTFSLLKKRIDKLGVAQPNVTLDEARNLILVELPGIDNPQRARQFLQATAELAFWDCYNLRDAQVTNGFFAANQYLISADNYEGGLTIDTIYRKDSLGNDILGEIERIDTLASAQGGPLFDKFSINDGTVGGLPVFGVADKNNRDAVLAYLEREDVKGNFPSDVKFLWGRNPVVDENNDATNQYMLYGVKVPFGGKATLTGENVQSAAYSPNPQSGEMEVTLVMDGKGTSLWANMTEAAANDNNREIAIVLDNEVASAPRVNEAIKGGSSSISGNFSTQEAKDLASILQVGKLPATVEIIQDSVIGPSLGEENIARSIKALLIGFGLVLLFMIAYYSTGGVVSILSLLLNLFFIFGVLAQFGTVLTLPGIAGIVLTIGMAVDANVIIYERIREELNLGKSVKNAITDGFSNSYSAIIDANVTTFLTAMVLAYFGLGPIKGFAVVLMVGVVSSIFTAVLVGRLLIDQWMKGGRSMNFSSGFSKNAFTGLTIDWLGKRKRAYVISSVIILAGIVSIFTRGFDLGIDFKGGYSYNVEFAKEVETDQIREALTASFGDAPVVKAVDTRNTFNIVTSYMIENTEDDAADKVMEALHAGISTIDQVSLADFRDIESKGKTHVVQSSKVGPTIADDITKSSYKAGLFALAIIFLYLLLRFSKWEFSVGAISALFHDVMVTLGIFSILWGIAPWSMEIDQAFIAAILTVIGYSINDTVVVFDRIREYTNTYTGKTKEEVINLAINSTVSRTVITSVTTLFVVLILFVFGGGSIKGFSFALLIGVIVGTYSSIFVATPILSDLLKNKSLSTKEANIKIKKAKAAKA